MINALIFIWIVVAMLAASAVAALVWAVQSGQFEQLQQSADSIFDPGEPIGEVTDAFPGSRSD